MRTTIKRRWLMAGLIFGSVLVGISLKMLLLAGLGVRSAFNAVSDNGLNPSAVAGGAGEVLVVVVIGGLLMAFGLALLVPSFILRRRLNRAKTPLS